jgi:hypothetical protein
MVEMLEALVINPQLKLISMLHDVQHVIADRERVLERCAEFLDFKDQLPILVDLLFTTEMTAH